MDMLGKVSGFSASGFAIVRVNGDVHLRIKQAVYNSQGEKVGEIIDVVGPVSRPWVLISGDLKVGQKVFMR